MSFTTLVKLSHVTKESQGLWGIWVITTQDGTFVLQPEEMASCLERRSDPTDRTIDRFVSQDLR